MADKAAAKKDEGQDPEVTPKGSAEISEVDLLKAATELEAKATGVEPVVEPEPDPSVKPVAAPELAKKIEDEGSEPLAKSLEISSTLKEVVDLMGEHVDSLSKAFAGTLDNQNAAILAITGALTGMQKSLDALAEKVEQYGEKPAAPASAKAPTAKPTEVLKKGAGAGSGDADQAPEVTKAQVNDALFGLMKAAKKEGDEDAENYWSNAAVRFDATGQISDKDLNSAINAHKKNSGQG